jgi:hypothetical protein
MSALEGPARRTPIRLFFQNVPRCFRNIISWSVPGRKRGQAAFPSPCKRGTAPSSLPPFAFPLHRYYCFLCSREVLGNAQRSL